MCQEQDRRVTAGFGLPGGHEDLYGEHPLKTPAIYEASSDDIDNSERGDLVSDYSMENEEYPALDFAISFMKS